MNDPQDYEYSGRRSRYPPVWQLLGYFGLGFGFIWLSFDRLSQFTAFEKPAVMRGLVPMIRVHWIEKILYEAGGKYLVFGFSFMAGIALIGFGIWRLSSWLKLRNSQ